MLELQNVTAGYKEMIVLNRISIKAEQGSITTILGENGSGKSTLLKTAMGLLPVTEGEVYVQGMPLSEMTRQQSAKLMAYLPQSKNTPDITAGRFVLHGRFPYLTYPRKYSLRDHEIAMTAMEQMGVGSLADVPLAELSGGMRQKVYIAMALAKQAPVILMDEPTTYLDIGQQKRFSEMVRELAHRGKTVVLVLHDIFLALKLSNQIYVLKNGKVKCSGTPEEALKSGVFSELYGVEIGTMQTPSGLQYYYK